MTRQRTQILIVCGVWLLAAATAALADPFAEVPANDPAYQAFAQLGAAGWCESEMDMSHRTTLLSRYEFALAVSKVIHRVTAQTQKDPAALQAQPQALRALRALMGQFRPELERLGVDVTASQKWLDDAVKVAPLPDSAAPVREPHVSPPASSPLSLDPRLQVRLPFTLTTERNPFPMKDLLGLGATPLVMTSIGSGLLAVDNTFTADADVGEVTLETEFFRLRDALTQEPHQLMQTEFKLPVTDNLSLSASLAQLRFLARGEAQSPQSWSAEAEYALGRWKLDASLRFAGSDQLASSLLGVPQAHPDSVWRAIGGGVTYAANDWLILFARIASVTDIRQMQSNYLVSSGGIGISLKDRISLEVGWQHVNPFDPAQSSSLATRLGLSAALSPTTRWQLFYQMFDDSSGHAAARPNIIATQVSVKF